MQRFLFKPNKTAFFLCDIQEKFRPHIYQMQDVINTARKMSEFSKLMNIPLVVTEQYPKALGHTCSEIDISHAIIVEPKTKFSMVLTSISEFLRKSEIQNVVLYGIEAQVCITQTAIDLLAHNVNVHILSDGISSINFGEQKVALNRLDRQCDITSSETVIFQILEDANHPKFKEVSSLVKKFQKETKENKLLNF
eukprot:NODE_407_length_9242_cov_0.441868.p5 type:complete len:195 gc:universal NODE_407_length_9242_cov_0.441868:6177-5593(-)